MLIPTPWSPSACKPGGSAWAAVFLFVGVLLRYYKGLHILLQAAQGQGWPIVIAGAGPIEAELKAQAAALGLQQVRISGLCA